MTHPLAKQAALHDQAWEALKAAVGRRLPRPLTEGEKSDLYNTVNRLWRKDFFAIYNTDIVQRFAYVVDEVLANYRSLAAGGGVATVPAAPPTRPEPTFRPPPATPPAAKQTKPTNIAPILLAAGAALLIFGKRGSR